LAEQLAALDAGSATPAQRTTLAEHVQLAVAALVARQVDVGIDVASDGETSKFSYATYVKQRVTGFDGPSKPLALSEFVIAGTDCGFATFADSPQVDPDVAWAKLGALTEGAEIASRELWQRKPRRGSTAVLNPDRPERGPASGVTL
jgi:methionine synthase II (cobalamin-independent)